MQTLPYHIRGSCIKADIQDENPCLRMHPYSAKEWSAYPPSPAERAREREALREMADHFFAAHENHGRSYSVARDGCILGS